MSYIAPSSDVYLLKGVHLDSGYNHTIWFENVTAQQQYFQSFVKPSQSGTSFHLTNLTYQRVNKGIIRVGIKADLLYDINYMMFKNTAYGNKWFYAFVDSVDYVNDNASELHYTIDVMQTWAFDYELGECFIERQHAKSDIAGDNVIDENLEIGEPQIVSRTKIDLGNQNIAVLSSVKPDNTKVQGEFRDNVYNGICLASGFRRNAYVVKIRATYANLYFEDYDTEYFDYEHNLPTVKIKAKSTLTVSNPVSVTAVKQNNTLDDITYNWVVTAKAGNSSLALDAYVIASGCRVHKVNNFTYWLKPVIEPRNFTVYLYDFPDDTGLVMSETSQINDYLNSFDDDTKVVSIYQYPALLDQREGNEISTIALIRPSTIYSGTSKSFTPKNKKLLTYPYLFVTVTSSDGDNADYRFEDSNTNGILALKCYATKNGTPMSILVPFEYRNHNGAVFEEGITFSDFPNCAWNADVFKTWWAQNKNSFMLSSICGAIRGGIRGGIYGNEGGAVGAIAGGIVGTAANIGNSVAKIADMKAVPPQAKGQVQSGTLRMALNEVGFYYMVMSLRPEYLQIIDNYFTMYGYAQKTLAVPDCHARRRFTFVKTKATVIHPASGTGLPADDEKAIAKIFENGITFWAKTLTVTPDIGNYTDPNPTL